LPAQANSFYSFLVEDNCSIVGCGAQAPFRVKEHGNFTADNQVKVSLKRTGYFQRHRYTSVRDSKNYNGLTTIFTQLRC
jgi:hypothetical protein